MKIFIGTVVKLVTLKVKHVKKKHAFTKKYAYITENYDAPFQTGQLCCLLTYK